MLCSSSRLQSSLSRSSCRGSLARPSLRLSRRGVAVAASQSGSKPYKVTLWDALKFNGPAPETINGRLAMIGFLNGAIYEAQHGDALIQQFTSMPFYVGGIMLLWTYASMVPITKGVQNNEAFGPFTPQAEMINGRAAMLGIALLLFIESKAGVPFF